MISLRELCLSLDVGESCIVEDDGKNRIHTITTYGLRSGRKLSTEKLAAIAGDTIVRMIRITRREDQPSPASQTA